MVDIKTLEQMAEEEWDREMAEFEQEAFEEFEPGRGYWDEMAANP